jgi:hypothetical protein
MRFHKTNDISQNFSGITLGYCEVLNYFVDFQFRFRYFQKMTPKFWFCLYRFKILKFWTWRWWKFKKSKSQLPKLWAWVVVSLYFHCLVHSWNFLPCTNITITYSQLYNTYFLRTDRQIRPDIKTGTCTIKHCGLVMYSNWQIL